MDIYGVINMDIVGSRKIKDRELLQKLLDKYISFANEELSGILTSPISITLGDEWQLITNKPKECYNIVHRFQQLLWSESLEFYAGIGIGELSTSVYEDTRRMDGICFHMAREALMIVKSNSGAGRKSNYSGSKRNKVYFRMNKDADHSIAFKYLDDAEKETYMETAASAGEYGLIAERAAGAPRLEAIINAIINNNEILKSKMTAKQKEAYVNYIKFGSYREMVRMQTDGSFGTIAAISQKLNTAEYFTIQHNHRIVEQLLKYACCQGGVGY